MSTLAYANLTNVRDDTSPLESVDKTKPGVNRYVDAMAALVPAEVLALHAMLITILTESAPGPGDGETVIKILEAGTLEMVFWALILLTFALYFLGRGKKHANKLDWLRMLVPPSAFVAWTMLQPSTAFDAAFPDVSSPTRMTIALFAAVTLGALVTWLAGKADAAPPPSNGDNPVTPGDEVELKPRA